MKKLFGNTAGLKSSQIKQLDKLYRRRIPPDYLITPELAVQLARVSHEIHRQIGILINRSGKIIHVIVGDSQKIIIPHTPEYVAAPGRLKGLRCIHTHLRQEGLSRDDLTDLALLRLDLMAALTLTRDGQPYRIHLAHIRPGTKNEPYKLLAPMYPNELEMGCLDFIRTVESDLDKAGSARIEADKGKERAVLISVTSGSKADAEDSLAELRELARSSGIKVIDTVLQQRRKIDPRFLLGRGKLNDLTILALQKGATLIVFDQELTPSQIRSITNQIEMKVIDRTQLILDIFAQRAQSREGKLQVELAQLKYLLPRLITKNTAMSRLTGGIGGRGPGETKLEINRRRVRDRLRRLEKELEQVRKHRRQQKFKRDKKGIPVISIVGYTNAGKSTLLNTLTRSRIHAENRLFATLDPSSRRLRFPEDVEVIITDTVGFIRNLPRDLMVAFRATLEELERADVLLHVIDISNPRFKDQIESVDKILTDLELNRIPIIHVLNKKDLLNADTMKRLDTIEDGIAISAENERTLPPLIEKMQTMISAIHSV